MRLSYSHSHIPFLSLPSTQHSHTRVPLPPPPPTRNPFPPDNTEFLEASLKAVDRGVTPWVVAHFHRPMYCTQSSSCDKGAAHLRAQAEDIMYDNKVDLTLCGHVHAYQRSNPVYKGAVVPGAPVYIMQGASGNREGNDGPYSPDQPAFIANSQSVFGYGILTIAADGQSLGWAFYDSASNAMLDSATYTK